MEGNSYDIGIPTLTNSGDGLWERTWTFTFGTRVSAGDFSEFLRRFSDMWIELSGIQTSATEAAITIRSAQKQDYVDFWDNGFRIMMLLSRAVALIEKIEHRERKHWWRFFSRADHESTLDRYRTPLMIAAKNGDGKRVFEEAQAANEIDEQSFSGKTALMYAAQYGHVEIVDFLLRRGATVTLFEPDWTPLQIATMSGSPEITRLFLDAGAEINGQNYYGVTALMSSVASGQTKVVELLLRRGARVDLSDKEGANIHDWAAKLLPTVRNDRYEEIDRLLKEFSS